MVTVLLYGHLAKQFGRRHCFDIVSPAEAVRALCANFKSFKSAIIRDGQAAYHVLAGLQDRTDANDLHLPIGKTNTIKIMPIVAGKGGLGKIILGAALIGLSFYLPGSAIGLTELGLFATSAASSIGFSLLLGGVSSLLFAPPKPKSSSNERAENKPSYAFNGAINTIGQGNPVPYFFGGPLRVGSQVISAGFSTENI